MDFVLPYRPANHPAEWCVTDRWSNLDKTKTFKKEVLLVYILNHKATKGLHQEFSTFLKPPTLLKQLKFVVPPASHF